MSNQENVMSIKKYLATGITILAMLTSCNEDKKSADMNIIFLHHSTGDYIWHGGPPSVFRKVIMKIAPGIDKKLGTKALVPSLFKEYNKNTGKNYCITEQIFPKASPYGWHNYPFDYYNIWVKNAGEKPYMEEPTLEILTKDYGMVIFKHCFPVGYIEADDDSANINSDKKTLANYKLQYSALKNKLHEFPDTKFIVWTGAALTERSTSPEKAKRTREFFDWVKKEWDEPGDNIFIWDFYELETEGGLYLKEKYAVSSTNSHPNKKLSELAAPLFFQRVIDVIENNGMKTTLTGK